LGVRGEIGPGRKRQAGRGRWNRGEKGRGGATDYFVGNKHYIYYEGTPPEGACVRNHGAGEEKIKKNSNRNREDFLLE